MSVVAELSISTDNVDKMMVFHPFLEHVDGFSLNGVGYAWT